MKVFVALEEGRQVYSVECPICGNKTSLDYGVEPEGGWLLGSYCIHLTKVKEEEKGVELTFLHRGRKVWWDYPLWERRSYDEGE